MKDRIDNFLIGIKYCYYFHKLLFDIILYLTYQQLFKTSSSKLLINIINRDIKNSGFAVIKLIQWILCKYKSLTTNSRETSQVYRFLINFNDVYENCNIHSYNYTRKVFSQDFGQSIEEIITLDPEYKIHSASIAQVYRGIFNSDGKTVAIKVTHPNLEEQLLCINFYYKIYTCLVYCSKYLRDNYTIPFDLTNFFDNFICQTDMWNEAKNLEYFYYHYQDNPLIVIPKPILSSKNILIMEYIDGENIDNLINNGDTNNTEYTLFRAISILNLFVRNNMINLSKIHADLHSSNWKIIKDNTDNILKIVIYDFGFCIDLKQQDRETIKNLNIALEINDHWLFINSIYINLYSQSNRDKFLREAQIFFNNDNHPINGTSFIEFCIEKNYILNSNVLDMMLSILLVNNYFILCNKRSNIEENFQLDNEPYIKKIDKLEVTNKQLINLSSICESHNCFPELQEYFKKYVTHNRTTIIKMKQSRDKSITDKPLNSLKFIDI
jgi:predicted unusual protein kinase regulating ubiquinone biosynthesis (AarF/ABC1/UbiB family)